MDPPPKLANPLNNIAPPLKPFAAAKGINTEVPIAAIVKKAPMPTTVGAIQSFCECLGVWFLGIALRTPLLSTGGGRERGTEAMDEVVRLCGLQGIVGREMC